MDRPMANEIMFIEIVMEKFQTINKNLMLRSIYEKQLDKLKSASISVGKKMKTATSVKK